MSEYNYEDYSGYDWDYILDDYSSTAYDTVYPEKEVAQALYIYIAPILLFLGTFGNLTSVVIMTRLSRKVLSTCLYLAVLAIVDLIVLYTRCGNDWLRTVANIDISNMLMVYTDSICKVYPFVFSFIFHMAKWLIVAMAIEGFISTRYPHHTLTMCTLERARAVILLLTVLLVCINSHYFWTFERIRLKDFTYSDALFCTFAKHGFQHSEEFQQVVWPIIDLLVSDVLPYVVCITTVVVMSVRIHKKLHLGDDEFQRWQNRYVLDPRSINQCKITILFVCVFFVLLTIPKFGYVIFTYVVHRHRLIEYWYEFDAKLVLAHAICSTLEHTFLSLKFFLYLATSQRFRTEFQALFKCLRGNKKQMNLVAANSDIPPPSTRKTKRVQNGIYQNVPASRHTIESQLSSTV